MRLERQEPRVSTTTASIESGAAAGPEMLMPSAPLVTGNDPADGSFSRLALITCPVDGGTLSVPPAGQSSTWRYTVPGFAVVRHHSRPCSGPARVPYTDSPLTPSQRPISSSRSTL